MNQEPRPIHVLYVQPNSEIGGSDIALARTIEAMQGTGQKSSVVLPSDGPLVARLRDAGADVYFLPMQQLRTIPSMLYQAKYLAKFLPTVFRMARLMRRLQPDLVHSNSLYCLYGAFGAKLARTRHLWHVREMAPSVPVLTWCYAAMVRRLSKTVLAMSDACVDALFRHPPDNVEVMPDALDADAFLKPRKPGRLRQELGIPPDTRIVGFAARLDPWKGVHVFLDACQKVAETNANVVFVIAGGAPEGLEQYEAELKQQTKNLGLEEKVLFLGWKYRLSDMVDVMDGFDMFCHTSIQAEPFGLVLLEAMSVGTPVIAARAGGPLTIIEDGISGVLTEPGNGEDLAGAITRLLNNPDLAERIGKAGQARQRDRFSVPQFVERLASIYKKTLAR